MPAAKIRFSYASTALPLPATSSLQKSASVFVARLTHASKSVCIWVVSVATTVWRLVTISPAVSPDECKRMLCFVSRKALIFFHVFFCCFAHLILTSNSDVPAPVVVAVPSPALAAALPSAALHSSKACTSASISWTVSVSALMIVLVEDLLASHSAFSSLQALAAVPVSWSRLSLVPQMPCLACNAAASSVALTAGQVVVG